MNVLLFGATGHLGRHLANRLTRAHRVTLAPRVDVADDRAIAALVEAASASVVVNAVGAKAGTAPDVLQAVNAEFPRRLASCAEAQGARVVHVSTDGVFSGAHGGYTEADAPDPLDAYGRSKLAGELGTPHLTVRTSFFGRNPRGSGLVEWLAAQHGVVRGFEDYRFSGLSAALTADLIGDAIDRGLDGTWHIGGDPITKYQLLEAVARTLRLDVSVVPIRNGAVDRTLESARFFAAIGRRRPTLEESMAALGAPSPSCV